MYENRVGYVILDLGILVYVFTLIKGLKLG